MPKAAASGLLTESLWPRNHPQKGFTIRRAEQLDLGLGLVATMGGKSSDPDAYFAVAVLRQGQVQSGSLPTKGLFWELGELASPLDRITGDVQGVEEFARSCREPRLGLVTGPGT
jgi:hypothetical protein